MQNKSTLFRFFILFILLFSATVQAQNFKWVRQIKGITYDYSDFANEMELDQDGNTYVFGETESFLFDLDPTVSGVEIINNSHIQNFRSLYLIKLDKDGNYLWGKMLGNYKRGGEYTYGMKIDKDGNLNLFATISELNTSQNIIDSFITIMKLKPNGDLISTQKIPRNFSGGASINPYSFDIDNQNNIFVTGYFIGSIILDPSNPSVNLTATGIDNFILKISNSGKFEWIKAFDNPSGSIGYSKVIVREDGNLNLLNGESLYKINSADNSIMWKKDFIDQGTDTFSVTKNNIVLVNHKNDISAIVDVDPSPTSTVNVFNNHFIIFLDLEGNFQTVKKYTKPTNGNIQFYSLAEDNKGNFIFVGSFKDKVNFDPLNSNLTLTSISDYGEGFYLKLDANKNFVDAFKLGHEQPQLSPYNNCYLFQMKRIKLLGDDNYIVGDFMWTCDFDPSLTQQHTLGTVNAGTINRDGFVLKLGSCQSSKPNGDENQYFCAASNTIANLLPNSANIKWYSSLNSTTPLLKTDPLVDGQTYYATQQSENCPESTERLAVLVHVVSKPLMPTIINSSFCKKENPTLDNIQMSGQNIKWYDLATNGNILPNTTLLEDNKTYYASQTVGCESDRTPVLVRIYDNPSPTGIKDQQFCIQQNATLSNINVTGQNIKWYDALTAGTLLPTTTALQNGITYYASQTLNGCESERIPFAITIQNTLAPAANANQSFCTNQNPTISSIQITGTSVKWYDALTNGSLLTGTTNLVNGKTYYASQTINNCEGPRFGITVSVVNTPSAPTANATQSFCKNENATLNTIQISGQNIKWFDTAMSASTLPSTTLLENNRTYYASQTVGCESDRTPVLVHVYDTTLPTGNNSQLFCIDENATIANLAVTGTNIKWYDLATNGTILPNTTLLQNKIYYATQTLNNCESERFAVIVKIQDTQNPIADSPQTFCIQQKAKISDINISGENIKWFESPTSTISLSESTLLENGITYYASETINNCESERISVAINILEATAGNCINLVEELPFPKFFTPNGDGYNDYWTIDFEYLAPNTGIKIFNRYGKFIKELNNNGFWDGNYLGQQQPASDYWFIVTRLNGKEFKGHFSLKR
ncbi:gliding motility-associated C-terminal domain-containing protein [Flavobacterium resistens]|uniref:Gliding motility-associated C-terminal domain-containing protein n=1 Tax=Flavobacterium resistens TaxID=443612 RepID=A0A521DUC6_9FLAO|nr:T9SS type B sorting domain-containing protein [Flavobacterium resistens]MRX68204.1 T9SS type B sorting domain-containing protein [Flavobacterium resistens]SMO74721.1 gliding motility-associated C-terminal domain-containing protein [Flavobacterium resistens]